MKNNYYFFNKKFYHVFLNNELILLDIKKDKFIFFDEEKSNEIKKIINSKINSGRNCNKEYLEFFSFFKEKNNLNEINGIIGVDSHSWRSVKFYVKNSTHKLSLQDRLKILFIYLFVFNFKNLYLKLIIFKFLKNNLTLKGKINYLDHEYINSVNSYIHEISYFLPFNLKCLEHSFILGFFLILNKYNCSINIGIQKYNFLSHSWVDVDKNVVGDHRNLSNLLAKIVSI